MLKLVARLSKFFAALLIIFIRFQQNYFDGPTKLFSDLYPVKSHCKFVLSVYERRKERDRKRERKNAVR